MKGQPILGHAPLPAIILIILQFSARINSLIVPPNNANTEYIKTSCNTTLYPRLCYRTLCNYATKIRTDPKLLAQTALNVTLFCTKSTSRLMRKVSRMHGLRPGEAAAAADCVEVVGDSVYELQRSIGEMENASARSSNFYLVINDIQTWVSAALTDDDTCMDGVNQVSMNEALKGVIRKHIARIAHLTSNALALVNSYASKETSP